MTNKTKEKKSDFYLDHDIEVNCDEDGETFICYGTSSKLKAFQEIKSFCDKECGLDKEYLPKMADLEISELWYGKAPYNNYGDYWYYWGNPPKDSKYLGLCWKYDVCGH